MNQVVSEKVAEIFVKQNRYKKLKNNSLFYIFTDKIAELSGEGEFMPHHEYHIDYEEKVCYFNDFDIDYKNEEKIYRNYKIIIKPYPKRLNLFLNVFIFNY